MPVVYGVSMTVLFRSVTEGEGVAAPAVKGHGGNRYSTVTLFARLRGWSTSVPFKTATW